MDCTDYDTNYWAAVHGDAVYGIGATTYDAEADANYNQRHRFASERTNWELLPCSEEAYYSISDDGFSHERIAILDNRVITRAELEAM